MQFMAMSVSPNQMMSFGATTEPCALCTLRSTGKISLQENEQYTKFITDKLGALGIPADR